MRFGAVAVLLMLVLRRGVSWTPVIRPALCGFLPRPVIRPLEGKHVHRPRSDEAAEAGKRCKQDIPLQNRLVRLAGGVSQWVIKEGGARRIHRLRDIQRAGHAQG